ncbi:hypothetical protein LOD99_4457 [Oopsacas minuta]|uniref:Uncharacterized protein n=1 Tax=Oopsacas minuta TaxID=111878 RepID=A0AAV7JW11_9METZ|nr:hypothetical protein LOD99_4457 [Oopsacas minuta]
MAKVIKKSVKTLFAKTISPPAPVKPLLDICLRYLSKSLHIEIITFGLFLLPKSHLTAIKEKLQDMYLTCGFTDVIFKCAEEGDYKSLPKWNWDEWCENAVIKSTEIMKCAIIFYDGTEITELSFSKNFAITKEEAIRIPKVIGLSNSLCGTSLTFEGKKYILFSNHPTMVFGDLIEIENLTENGEWKPNTQDSSCIVASMDVRSGQRLFVVVLSSFNNALIPNILSLQKLAEEITHFCKYLAEYFAYINGESPYAASGKFV